MTATSEGLAPVVDLAELEARLRRLEATVEALEAAAGTAAGAEAAPGSQLEPAFPDVQMWVNEHFAPIFGRPLGGEYRWCPCWWDHAEALERLEALWRSWEALRLDPVFGMALWYRDHLDHQLPVLLSSRGPFGRCSADRHESPRALPVEPAPQSYLQASESE